MSQEIKDAFGRCIVVGDIVAIGHDRHQDLGVIRGFTPTEQTQLVVCTYNRQIVKDDRGYYIYDHDKRSYRYTDERKIEIFNVTMKYPKRLIKMSDHMLQDFDYPEQVANLKKIQADIMNNLK